MSDPVTVKFKVVVNKYETKTRRWCTVCKWVQQVIGMNQILTVVQEWQAVYFVLWKAQGFPQRGLVSSTGLLGWCQVPGSGDIRCQVGSRYCHLSPTQYIRLNLSQLWQHQPPGLPYHIPHHTTSAMPSNCIQHTLQGQRCEMWLKMVWYFDFLIILYWIIAILGGFHASKRV